MHRALRTLAVLALLAGLQPALHAKTQQAPTEQPAKPATPPDPSRPPTEAEAGAPIYPNAEYITVFDAGQGQKYYLFGTNAPFATVVAYYKNVLKDRGELVFEEPPVHEFDIGRYKEETMAFPPSVTVKDYTWGGMEGYLNPKLGAQPERFKTIIQIVPPPAGGENGTLSSSFASSRPQSKQAQ